MQVPILYEGLHDVYPLCGGESHQLKIFPKLPAQTKIEVFVEKFDAEVVSQANKTISAPSNSPQSN